MKYSTATSVLVHYAIEDVVPIIKEAGFDGLDIWGGRPHVYRDDYSAGELRKLADVVRQSSLEVPSFMPAFYRYPHSLSGPNDTVRQDSVGYMKKCADNAAILDAKILLIVPGHSLAGQTVSDARSRLVESIQTICEYCEQYSFRLGIEPANSSVTDLVVTHEDALEIIGLIGHQLLGVVMDSGHLFLNGEKLPDIFRNLRRLLLQFHVSDNDGQSQQNAIPGEGKFDFPAFFRELELQQYTGFVSAELGYHYANDPLPALRETLKRLKNWGG
ncbi:MAG: TIM barrel protein [Anaerolineales bacterium]|nr:TIM barrel protein [Anaerolineales bacterium]